MTEIEMNKKFIICSEFKKTVIIIVIELVLSCNVQDTLLSWFEWISSFNLHKNHMNDILLIYLFYKG